VVYADLAGYSRLIGEDDAGTFARMRELRADLIDPAIARHGGRLVDAAGDSLLVLFDSILDAMRFSIEVQRAVPSYDGEHAPERRLRFRMGVNVGDVVSEGTTTYGDGINVAARLQTVCPIGAICVSRIVREQVGNRLGLPFKELGALALKNIERPVEAFVLDPANSAPLAPAGVARTRTHLLAFAGVAAFAGLVAGLAWQLHPRAPPDPEIAAQAHQANSSGAPPLSIAVLPFNNMSGDPEQAYVADGIAEDLTTDLAHLAGAFVVARESAFSFRGKALDIRDIGHQLGVRYVLEGSVRRISTTVRISAQLIATESGAHVWAERFDKPLASLGEGQDDIVAHIASALGVSMINLDASRAARTQSGSPAAFDLVLRARAALNEPPSDEQKYNEQKYIALGLFLQALRNDPNSVPAMAGAAAMYAWLFNNDAMVTRASQLVAAAEAKAPDSPDVVAAKFMLLQREQRFRDALALYNRLLDVNPSATSLILQLMCRCWASAEEALLPLERTIRLNPRSPQLGHLKVEYARVLLMLGRTGEAITTLEPLVTWSLDTESPSDADGTSTSWQSDSRVFLAIAYVRAQRADNAKQIIARALKADNLREFTVRNFRRGIPLYSSPENVTRLQLMADDLRLAGVPDHMDETLDSGVPSSGEMRDRARINTPTPMGVPGGHTVTTQDVIALLAKEKPLILSTTPFTPTIPGTLLITLATGGTLDDDWQPRLGRLMRQLTNGDVNRPVLVFAFNQNRWHSRNLALRLIALGYKNVFWYRGGWEAWEASEQPRAPLAGRRNL
jgi:TolB-like protein/class 3 adenylate cyclase/tetratricopeptide (TPR) repeat protein